jgi:hypothetical protein
VGPAKRAFYEAEPDSPFYLYRKSPHENVPEAMKDYMRSEDNIRDVTRSRDELSASGNNGINCRIMKIGGLEAVKFMRYLIKATIRCDRVMDSWKKARILLIYKKVDHEDLKSWRPITITNCISRIYTSLMARAFEQINLQHEIYVDAKKGFIKKTKGCSKHGILLNELFQDAKRKNKDLIVRAIDFSNAFGSVPHHLIMSTLKQLNFPIWVRIIIKDGYDNAKSTIDGRGRQACSTKWGKGVKQGCLLSPLSFNLSLEPLLETIKRNENIQGAHMRTKEELFIKVPVQASVDDAVFVSENEDRITQMLQILDQFME